MKYDRLLEYDVFGDVQIISEIEANMIIKRYDALQRETIEEYTHRIAREWSKYTD